MKKLMAVLAASISLFALGCATTYTSADDSITGGYTDTRLAPDTWLVVVQGNSLTSRGEVEQYAMRRCAELTLEQGKRYFVLDQHRAWMEIARTPSGVVTFPKNRAVVTAMDEKSRDTFDAVTIIEETNKVAKGKLSEKAKQTLSTLSDV